MSVLETVLRCDTERSELLQEEARLLAILNPSEAQQDESVVAVANGKAGSGEHKLNGKDPRQGGRKGGAVQLASDPEASAKLEKAWLDKCSESVNFADQLIFSCNPSGAPIQIPLMDWRPIHSLSSVAH